MALIFFFSSQPGGEELAWWEVVLRKIGHFSAYAALATAWFWALSGSVRRRLLWACAISLAYAVSDELHQTFVEGRHGTPVDVVIDSMGIATAALAIHRFAIRRPRYLQGRSSRPDERRAT
jgi:VanZ family protein